MATTSTSMGVPSSFKKRSCRLAPTPPRSCTWRMRSPTVARYAGCTNSKIERPSSSWGVAGQLACDHLAYQGHRFGRDDLGGAPAKHVAGRVAEHALAGAVDRGEGALQVVGVDDVMRILEQLAVARFAFGVAPGALP